jgi:hypothetical protein
LSEIRKNGQHRPARKKDICIKLPNYSWDCRKIKFVSGMKMALKERTLVKINKIIGKST